MRILALAASYPYSKFPFSGIFNERCVLALKELCDYIEVLVPRPYVPRYLALHPRWKMYSKIISYEKRNGVIIHRPPIFIIPKIGGAFWYGFGAYLSCRDYARKLHQKLNFDVIISFDLLGAGGLAWRIGKDLGIPSCGWAFGSDIRVSTSSSSGKLVIHAIDNLDLIFYQSLELLEQSAQLIEISLEDMLLEKHVVLPHGIPIPTETPREENRKNIRNRWGISDNELVVLSLGRITKQKGIYELFDAISCALFYDNRITCILVGSMPAFDETEIVKKNLGKDPVLKNKVRIFPACNPDEIWDVLSAADIFAFTSHKEGMPNSLLEAMAMGLPAVSFAIPAVEELDAGTNSLIKVPPLNSKLFARAILALVNSPTDRMKLGEKGRKHIIEHYNISKNMVRAIEKISTVVKRYRK